MLDPAQWHNQRVPPHTMALQVGSRLGHYDVTALIGEGGMGQVWQATDTQLNREVAIKILSEEFAADPERLAAFEKEATIVASLNHPAIVIVHSVERCEGVSFLTMELVRGQTLADRIPSGGLPPKEFFALAVPLVGLVLELVEGPTLTGSPKVPFPLTKRCRSRVLTSPPHRRVQQRHPAAGWPSFSPPRWSKFCSALDKPSHTPPPFARMSFLAAVYKLKRHCRIGSAGIVLVHLHLLAGGQLNRLHKMEKLRFD